jgi:uncharacterized membrane protein
MEFLAGLHPKLVHFPVVLIVLYALFEIFGILLKKSFLSKSAYVLLVISIISALAAIMTGEQALKLAEAWNDKGLRYDELVIPFGLIDKHEDYATITIWYFVALFIFRTFILVKKKFDGNLKYAVALLAAVGCFFIFKTGELGGELVYKHGVGTEIIKPVDTVPAKIDSSKSAN